MLLNKPIDPIKKKSEAAALIKNNRSKCANNCKIFNRDELKLLKIVNFRDKWSRFVHIHIICYNIALSSTIIKTLIYQ